MPDEKDPKVPKRNADVPVRPAADAELEHELSKKVTPPDPLPDGSVSPGRGDDRGRK